ncbi:MAG: MBL fold metallo-hydrolase [Cystobacterineae bacterium]|nr:MBL fold metallo-hydrolase [Cystobacterineae bacterium]
MRIKIGAAFALCIALGLGCASASKGGLARADIKLHAEGHMPLGTAKIWPLSDGEVRLKPSLFQGIPSEEKLKALGVEIEEEELPTSLNAYFIEWGESRILVDAGAGVFMGPGAGHVVSALAERGIAPESIDAVLLTHLHGDHFGGLIEGEAPRFPNATLWVHETEFLFWTNPQLVDSRPEEQREGYAELQQGVLLFAKTLNHKLKTFNAEQELFPGLRAMPAPGHTPGHTAFMLESEGQKLLIWGDLAHNIQLQTAFPKAYPLFDVEPEVAIATRLQWMKKAADEGFWVAGMHLPHPGIGRLEKAGEQFRFVPMAKE